MAVRWRSVISTPTVFSAPIIIRNYDGTEVVAQVEYRPGQKAKSGTFALNGTAVTGVTWKQNVSQFFEVTIDLDTDVVELRIGANNWPGSLVASGTTTATNVGRVGVELVGNDAQIMGLDSVTVTLLPDAQ